MSTHKKRIIILLVIIFLLFIIALTIIIIKNHKKSNVVENQTTEKINDNEIITTEEYNFANSKQEQIEIKEYENSFIYSIIDDSDGVNEIMCVNINKLTPEQDADKETLIQKAIGYSRSCQKSITQIDISDSSNEEQIYATLSYVNDEPEEIVILYDKYKTHSFTRCINKQEYELIQAGECAG